MLSIQLDLAPSKQLTCLFAILYGGGIGMLWWAVIQGGLWLALAIPLTFFTLGAGYYTWRRYISLRHPRAVVRLVWHAATGLWQLAYANGEVINATLCGDSVLTAVFGLLRFKQAHKFLQIPVLISQGTVSPSHYRQLCKWWRYYNKIYDPNGYGSY